MISAIAACKAPRGGFFLPLVAQMYGSTPCNAGVILMTGLLPQLTSAMPQLSIVVRKIPSKNEGSIQETNNFGNSKSLRTR
jgi:hypothetical protein